jgi:hypothetical protein
MWKKGSAVSLLAIALLLACGGGNSGNSGGGGATEAKLHERCSPYSPPCGPGLVCVTLESDIGTCLLPCPDGVCPEWSACGKDESGAPVCTPTCSTPDKVLAFPSNSACENGARVACSQATPTSCAECGCGGVLRCEFGVGCGERFAEGTPCKLDSDCKSDNCGLLTGVCNVPMGAKCTGLPCDLCMRNAFGKEYCSRTCGGVGSCTAGFSCGIESSGEGICNPGCAGCIEENCKRYAKSDQFYCDCVGCTATRGKGIAGVPCAKDNACLSGHCSAGRCVDSCGASEECAAGEKCAVVNPGESATCVACKNCPYCRVGTSVEGGEASWCDPRKADGQACTKANECASDKCTGGRCGAEGGNGAACTGAAQCTSKNCVGGICKGAGLIGDGCTIPADCAVGWCCESGPSAGKCATSC